MDEDNWVTGVIYITLLIGVINKIPLITMFFRAPPCRFVNLFWNGSLTHNSLISRRLGDCESAVWFGD